jgi:hypothetical protein
MARLPRVLMVVLASASLSAERVVAEAVEFESQVRPVLKAHCWQCHGEGDQLEGSLDARLARSILAGGDSGPAIVSGDHEQSLLYQRISAGEMPPGDKKLSAPQIEVIARWIDGGAKTAREEPASLPPGQVVGDEERSHWSFQPIRRPAAPEVKEASLVRTPIDAFLLSALEAKGLSFSPLADKRVLIRRLYYDLTGLPPSLEAIRKFLSDQAPDAYERLVDEVLASPNYGEHWARHWLDVVGYADSDGYSGMDAPRKWAYRYRDYVIRALNDDKPWNEFLVEQLAGDELVPQPPVNLSPEQADKLIATGMLRMGPDGTSDSSVDQNLARNDVVANTVKIVSTAVLGLTVGCAQCHDHRYDPISHVDYHRIRAIFEPAYDWKDWRAPDARLVSLWSDETRKQAAAVNEELQRISGERNAELDEIVRQTFERELAKLPSELQPAARAAHETSPDKRSEQQQELIKRHPFLNVDRGTVYLYLTDQLAGFNKKWDDRTAEARKKMPADDFVQCLTETPEHIPVTKLFARGDFNAPKQDVAPGVLSVLNNEKFTIAENDPQLPTSGRRLAYARWLTSGRHPLVARVLVNRFWLHHFGHGLVDTPGDFGALGQRPSHPELLDWLADEFMAAGWKLKQLQRMIVTSTAYRQSSDHRAELDAVDSDNRLLGRMNLRRLDAELVRDALLAASGRLSAKMYGPPTPVTPDDVGQIVVGVDTRDSSGRPTGKVVDLGEDEFRRSLYVQVQRSKPLGILETFDAPLMAPNCEQRASSTNAPQSLLLMNNAFVVQQCEAMAERIENESGGDLSAQFSRAWELAFGALPSEDQTKAGLAFLAEQAELVKKCLPADGNSAQTKPARAALAHLCHALVISNGFLYVE